MYHARPPLTSSRAWATCLRTLWEAEAREVAAKLVAPRAVVAMVAAVEALAATREVELTEAAAAAVRGAPSP